MDKQSRFKLTLPRFFKSSYASCRSLILSNTTTTNLPSSQPINPPSSRFSSTSFRSLSKPTHPSSKSISHAPFYYPHFPSSASPVSSLILDREFYHNPRSKKQNKKQNKNKKNKMEKSERTFSCRSKRLERVEIDSSSEDYNDESDDDDVFFSSRSRSSSDSSNEMRTENVVAVVKRSSDPYEDFRTSMVEMIVEKQILNGKDLDLLLQSFLDLNSRCHHRVILNVFVEILEALFGPSD